ncbi:MAG TPA: RsmG family class I SAM-dependent methyltransferase [Acidimicrobiia bacterium]|nr:RsmG family class I SAM-dependent methyltransferase [Acidimicrobiia bacterium]
MNPRLEAAASQIGVSLDAGMRGRLATLGTWLATEAIVAGGLGPNEAASIEERHLADSMLFAAGWVVPPSVCWDLGSGAGLPGLVLACIWPQTKLVLVDSSTRRCELAQRGARVVGVEVQLQLSQIEELEGPFEAIVSRAAIPATDFGPILRRLLAPGGVAVISGGSDRVPAGFERLRFAGDEFFDRAARLLIMRSP